VIPGAHLPIVPIVLPLLTAAVLLLFGEGRRGIKAVLSIASMTMLLAAAISLLRLADAPGATVYALGAWPAPFGIVLVVDRLAATMVTLSALLGFAATIYSVARWDRAGARYHALVQFLLMGLNGAFLTGDLFNLFVFFELLLAASYGLALHGSGAARVRASLHYIVINLAASLLFLVGVSLIYGVTGTLNMAQLAERLPQVVAADRALVESGVAVLSIAFLVKAGMWPLGFWLPTTYAMASAPSAALFTVLSKVGVYAVLRLWLLLFGGGVEGFGKELLFWGGIATVGFGVIAMLASQDLARMGGAGLLVSSGTALAAFSQGHDGATAAALFYLVGSTLGIAAFFLLVELVQRVRPPGADVLAVTAEAFGLPAPDEEPEADHAQGIPAALAIMAFCFIACALLVAGLPPLPGFIGKFAIFAAVLEPDGAAPRAWILIAMLTLSGLAAVVALGRSGVRIFWASKPAPEPKVVALEIAPVAGLLALCLLLTIAAGPATRYLSDAARALHAPRTYVDSVLTRP
jgi:multicomponent K+:H+ antiporter subunit D